MEKPHYTGCVYRATLLVGNKRKRCCYIGKALTGLAARKSQHYAQARRGITTHFAQAIMAYSKEAFLWEELFSSDDDHLLKVVEIEQIAAHKTLGWRLYNHSIGGDGVTGWKWSAEHRAKVMATIAIRKANGLTKKSAKTRKLISEAAIGRKAHPISPEGRARISQAKKEYWARALSGPDAEKVRAQLRAASEVSRIKRPQPPLRGI